MDQWKVVDVGKLGVEKRAWVNCRFRAVGSLGPKDLGCHCVVPVRCCTEMGKGSDDSSWKNMI